MEKEQKAEDTAIRKNNKDGADLADAIVRRSTGGTLAQLSGGGSTRYRDAPTTAAKRHPLFSNRMRK